MNKQFQNVVEKHRVKKLAKKIDALYLGITEDGRHHIIFTAKNEFALIDVKNQDILVRV